MEIKLIPSFQPRERPKLSWAHLFIALSFMFSKLPKTQKVHAVVALFTGCLCVGGLAVLFVSQVAENYTPPVKVMGPMAPMNITLNIPEPSFNGSESEYVEEKPAVKKKPKERNEQAPRFVSSIVPKNAEAYIRMYAKAAQQSQRKYKVPASITLAQGLVEGNAGQSSLAREANNHFGIKCFSKNCRKGHCVNKTDDTHKDFFKRYGSVQECFNDHGAKISSGRYSHLKRNGNDYKAWARGLKKCGYATDRNYATTLIATIERYDLYKYD